MQLKRIAICGRRESDCFAVRRDNDGQAVREGEKERSGRGRLLFVNGVIGFHAEQMIDLALNSDSLLVVDPGVPVFN